MTTPTIQFSTRTILYCAGVMALSFGFVFGTLGSYEKQAVEQARITQEFTKMVMKGD